MSDAEREGWTRLRITDIADFGSGAGISVAKLSSRSPANPVPVFGGNGIAGFTASATVQTPTVIIGRVGQKCGSVYTNNGPAWITDNALYARRFRTLTDVPFLSLALEAARLNDVRNHNDLPLITQGILRDVTIPWPVAINEQRAIASALSSAGELIEALERQIAKKQAIKQGLSQQLLTGSSRLPGFMAKWDEVSLGEAGTISGGGVDKNSNPGEESVRLLNYMDVYRAEFVTSATATQVVTAPTAKLTKCAVRAGDVFFTPTSETPDDIARSAVASCDLPGVVYSYHLVRWRPFDEWDSSYLAYAFSTERFRRQASIMAAGSGTRYVVSMPAFRSLVALRPPVEEQRAIGSVLRDASTEIESLRSRLAKARAIKTGMMQQLLTGRTRLPAKEAAA